MSAGKNREGVVTVGIDGALFPIRSPFQATHHYLHSIVEQAKVLPLCIRERNKQQRRRRLRTRPGGQYSGFQVTGMIEAGQKSKPKQIPRATQKNTCLNFPTKKIPKLKIS